MAHTIKLKRTSTAGNKPDNTNITTGELALNTADKSLYIQTGTANTDIVTLYDDGILHLDDTNNRVGIGTTSPAYKLDVNGTFRASGNGYFDGSNINFSTAGANIKFNGGGGYISTTTAHALRLQTNNTEALRLTSGQNAVFAGTISSGAITATGTSTLSGLSINSAFTFPTSDGSANQVLKTDGSGNVTWATEAATSAQISITDADGDTKIQVEESADEDKIRFDTAGTERMIIDESGNVGIGTTSPSQRLQVAGTILADTALGASSGTNAIGIGSESNITDTSSTYRIKLLSDSNNAKLTTYAYSSYLTLKAGVDGAGYSGNWSKIEIRDGGGTGSNNAHMKFYTHGDERMVIDNYGKVGIGTTSPGRKLTVQGASGDNLPLRIIGGSGTNHGSMEFQDPNTTADYKVTIGSKTDDFYIQAGGTEKVRVLANGNVGIGTNNPIQKLQVAGAIYANGGNIFIDSGNRLIWGNSQQFIEATNSGPMQFGTGNAERMRIDSSGNVGIGTTTPEAKLHTIGHSRLDGAMLQKSNLSIASANISTGNEYISHNGPVLTNGSTGNINQYGYFRGYQAVYGNDGTNGFNPYAQGAYSNPVFEFVSNNRGTISLPTDAAIRDGYLYQFVLGNSGSGGTNSGVELTSSNTTLLWGITSSNDAYFANNVGIGTNSPNYLLDIESTSSTLLRVHNTGSNVLTSLIAQNDLGTAKFGTQSGYSRIHSGSTLTYAASTTDSIFYSSGTEKMRVTGTGLTIGTATDTTTLVFPDKTGIPDSPTETNDKVQLIKMGQSGNGGMWQTTGRGGMLISSADDSLVLANGDAGRFYDPNAGGHHPGVANETLALLSDFDIRFTTGLQDGWSGGSSYTPSTSVFDSAGNLGIGTTSPSQKLDVVGLIRSGGIAHPEIELVPTGSVGNADIRFDGTSLDIRSNSSGAYLTLQTATTERLKITNTGNFEFNNGNFTEVGTVTASGIVNIGGGTSYYSEKLLVQGRTRVAGQLDIAAGTGYGNYAKFTHDDTELEIATVRSAGTNGQIVLSPLGTAALTLDTSQNAVFSGTISSGNITTTGYLAGPATFTIDPAAVGDNSGTVVIAGNLQVDGTTTTINSTTLTVDDLNITLASGSTNAAAANGAGITVDCGSDTDATLTYLSSGDQWKFNKELLVQDSNFPQLRLADADDSMEIGYAGENFFFKRNDNDGAIIFRRTDNSDVMSVAMSTKRVGIGSSSPTYGFQVSNSNTSQSATGTMYVNAKLNSSGKGLVIDSNTRTTNDNAVAALETITRANTTGLKVQVDGKVGIGTNSPAQTLHVNSGQILVGSNTGAGVLVNSTGSIELCRTAGLADPFIDFKDDSTQDYDVRLQMDDGHFKIANTGGERVRVASTGNVGIGQNNPTTRKLEVYHSANAATGILVENANTGTGAYAGISFKNDAGGSVLPGVILNGSNQTAYAGANSLNVYQFNQNPIGFVTGNSLRMAIQGDGKVGVGTNSPQGKFQVNGDIIVTANDGAYTAEYFARLKSSYNENPLALESRAGDVLRASNYGQALSFLTGSNANGTSERMTIDQNGKVGINQNVPAYQLDVNGNARIYGMVFNASGAVRSINTHAAGGLLQLGGGTSTSNGAYINIAGDSYGSGDYIQLYAGNTYISGNLGVAESSPSARFQVEALGIDTTTTSTASTAQAVIDTFTAATFRSARYTIQVTNSTDSTYHITEILLIHDGTTPQITEYGTIFTGSAEATFDADISGANVRLIATPATTDSMTFKVVRHCITV